MKTHSRWSRAARRDFPGTTPVKDAFSEAIGSSGGGWGTGFIVTTDGYILTNKHVAAPWKVSYSFGGAQQVPPGLLMDSQSGKILQTGVPPPQDWIPENTKTVPPGFTGNFEAESKLYAQLFIQCLKRFNVVGKVLMINLGPAGVVN